MSAGDAGFVPWPEEFARAYRLRGLWAGESLSALLERVSQRFAERTALVDRHGTLSYADLFARVERLARGLFAHGIGPRDAVIVQLPNRAAFVETIFALFRLGARPIMAQPAHRRAELGEFARHTRACAHVVQGEFARCDYVALSESVRADVPTLRQTIALEGDARALDYARLFDVGSALPLPPSADDIALFQLSGGSTNVPKLIARTHDDYAYSVHASVLACGFDEHTVYLAALPVAHNFPLSSPGILGVLSVGGRVVLSEQPAPDVAFPWVAREQVTHTALVPALVPVWLSAAARMRDDLTSLSLVQVGGARLSDEQARRVPAALGARLQQVFGMAEGLVSYTRLDADITDIVDARVYPMSDADELRVVDDADRPVGPDELGHLLVRGPYTVRGYFDASQHNREAFTDDGFYRTGDLVVRSADGALRVMGRAKDQINRGGEKIAAPEVEQALCSHAHVESAALVAMPDKFLGERSCAFVVLTQATTKAELLAHLRALGLADYKLPDRFEFRSHLPRTAVGKIDKRSLAREASAPRTTRPENPA